MSNDDTYKAFASRPHLVIVGAGATIDSIPNGDKNGQQSAVMKGFIDKLGFTGILADSGIQFDSDNLEYFFLLLDFAFKVFFGWEVCEVFCCEELRILVEN